LQTCQTIAFLSWLKHSHDINQQSSRPHLVIAPASVVSNWELEFQKFAPHLNVVKYHGSMNERTDIQLRLKKYLTDNNNKNGKNVRDISATQLDVIIAPVTYFQQEKSDDRYFLKKFQYDYMIVDEAHLLKNSRGMRYKSLDRFKTMHRLLLTVSVHEICLSTLYSLFLPQSFTNRLPRINSFLSCFRELPSKTVQRN
jgi:SNF2 family DNA or RNA helicase